MDAEQLPQQLPTAPFPAAPPFWKYFTSENVERLTEIQSQARNDSAQTSFELSFLRPPPPPDTDAQTYTTFSSQQSLNPAPLLPPADVLLFDSDASNLNHATLLSKLTKSLLLNFLELTALLGNNPVEFQDKMDDLNRLMLNVHSVINMYRPHQAREGVKEMLEARLEDGRKEIEKCDRMKEKVETFLRQVQEQYLNDGKVEVIASETKVVSALSQKKLGESKKMWNLIHQMDDEKVSSW